MLKQRLITTLVLVPILIWIIKLPNPIYFEIVLAIVGIIAAKEWGKLSRFSTTRHYVFFAFLGLFFTVLALYFVLATDSIMAITLLFLGWWLLNLVFVFRYPKSQKYWYGNLYLRMVNGVFLLVPSLLLIGFLHAVNANALLFLLLIIWSADVGAYFAGKRFGKHLLAAKISPKKTIEGVIGGVLSSLILTAILSAWIYGQVEPKYLLLSGLVALMSVLGDLYESLFKRAANVKDSGAILPGHGGILDRIDSLTSAVILFVFLAIVMQILPISPINPDVFLSFVAPILK